MRDQGYVMFDAGMIDFNEPFTALRNQGMIPSPDGRKMVRAGQHHYFPDEIIEQGYGADAIRVMELFIGPGTKSQLERKGHGRLLPLLCSAPGP